MLFIFTSAAHPCFDIFLKNSPDKRMGVPSLYRWLTQRYPEIRKKIGKVSHITIDNLYLDFNAIIHPCCNKELDSMDETEKQLYNNITDYLEMVVEKMRPRKLLYISIDGVAPRAKLNQQRSRRFISAKENKDSGATYFKDRVSETPFSSKKTSQGNQLSVTDETLESLIEEEEANQVFDANAITPGTEFMMRLDKFMKDLISYKVSTDPLWSELTVIFSGFQVPGEGEEKILEYIRLHQNSDATNVIYSPDADLIFLGLTLHNHRLLVMREEFQPGRVEVPVTGNKYLHKEIVLVDINKLRSLLISHFKTNLQFDFNYRKFIDDWVFMCFMAGNDFLPCMPCFEIRANAIDKITNVMLSVFKRTRRHITNNGNVDLRVLREIFLACSQREDEFLAEKKSNLLAVRAKMNLPLREEEEFDLTTNKGKARFYMEKMGVFTEKALEDACMEYIRGMVWIYRYYFYGVPSWDWFYPYHFAPFMIDLATIESVNMEFTAGRPLRPMEQLLAVLPSMSKDLLPECLHDVFSINEEFYPTEFKVDTFQKCMDWQAVPILPFIDIKKIVRCFNDRQSKLTYGETMRNVIGYTLLYTRNPLVLKKGEMIYNEMKPHEYVDLSEYKGRVYAVPTAQRVGATVESSGFRHVNMALCLSFDQRKGRTSSRPH